MGPVHLVSVACNHCGAALQVSEQTRFATCNYCGRQLAIHRTESTSYTEVLNEIRNTTERVESNLATIRLHNELERLDREWLLERERYLIHDKDGIGSEPSGTSSVIVGAAGTLFGLFSIGFAWNTSATYAGCAGPLIVAVAWIAAINGLNKARRFEQARRRYEIKRQSITQQLDGVAAANDTVPADQTNPFSYLSNP